MGDQLHHRHRDLHRLIDQLTPEQAEIVYAYAWELMSRSDPAAAESFTKPLVDHPGLR